MVEEGHYVLHRRNEITRRTAESVIWFQPPESTVLDDLKAAVAAYYGPDWLH